MTTTTLDRRPALSIIVPCFNEAARLGATLADIRLWLARESLPAEIIVVDDGSGDDTSDLVSRLARDAPELRLIRLSANQGKGAAVAAGMLAALGDLRGFVDADGAVPFEEIRKLMAAIADGAALAVGSRVVDPSLVDALLHRRLFGVLFRLWVNVLAVRTVRDTQCGFKLFTAAAAESLFPDLRSPRFAFDVEVLRRAERRGLRIAEVAVRWREQRGSKVRVLRDGLAMAAEVLRISRLD